jgi:hypothetical protein
MASHSLPGRIACVWGFDRACERTDRDVRLGTLEKHHHRADGRRRGQVGARRKVGPIPAEPFERRSSKRRAPLPHGGLKMSLPTTVINEAPAPRGDGKFTVPSHHVDQQHFGPFDPAARIAELKARITALEVKVFGRTAPK